MKRPLLIVIAFCLCTSAFPAWNGADSMATRPKIGLVLSGGGARGAAHVGVIRLIEEMQLPIDYVVGTSMGAIVGALYATGYTADEMDSLMMAQDWKMLLSNDLPRLHQPYELRMAKKRYQISIPYEKGVFTENSALYRDAGIKVRRTSLQTFPKVLARPGLIDGNNLMHIFEQLTSAYADSMSYDTLPHSFACVATDLVTGKEVVLREGRLAESIRASMSIPGVFYPVYEGNQVLVDGGVVNNYPVNVAREMGADIVIGVEVNSAHIDARALQSFASIFERLIGTLGSDLHEQNVDDTDILIRPQVRHFPVMGFDTVNLRHLMDIGYRTALLSKPQLDSVKRVAVLDTMCKVGKMDGSALRANSASSREESGMEQRVATAPTNQVALGMRFDSEEGAAALLRIGASRHDLPKLRLDLTTRMSLHPWLSARLAYSKSDMPQANLAVRYGYTDIATPYGKRNDSFSYHFCGADLYLSHILSLAFDLSAGVRYDNYWVQNHMGYDSRQSFTTLYASWKNDLYDAAYTPTRGYAYGLEAAYNIKDKSAQGSNFWALQADASAVIPLAKNTALLTALHTRLLWGENIPQIYANALGGYLPHRYLRQQLPFVGIKGCEFVNPYLILPSVGVRQRLLADVYATIIANYAYSTDALRASASSQSIWGIGLQLSYDTTIGPIMLCTHWNDLYHQVGLYFSMGFEF